jgi:hypothetical protein
MAPDGTILNFVRKARRLWVVGLAAVPLSQLGHLLAAQLHNPGAALGAGLHHVYFAAGLELSLAVLGGAMLAGLLTLAAARRLTGRELRAGEGWPLPWLVLALAAAQLEIYFVQELLEGSSSYDAARYGLAGQLPVALLAALAIRHLSARLGPALRILRRPPVLPQATLAPVAAPAGFAPRALAGLRASGVRAGRAPPD